MEMKGKKRKITKRPFNINTNNDISISLDLKINKKYDGYILKKIKILLKMIKKY